MEHKSGKKAMLSLYALYQLKKREPF